MGTEPVTTRRAPVLRPRATSGRGLLFARGCRVLVDDSGALVTRRPDGEVTRIAGPGEVTQVLVLDHELTRSRLGREDSYAGALVLLAGLRPVLALRLVDWGPPAELGSAHRRTTAGIVALAAALGLPLEPAEPDTPGLEARSLRQVAMSPIAAPARPGRLATPLGFVAILLACLAGPTGGRPAAAVVIVLSLLITGPLVLALLRGRSQARTALATTLPPAEGVRIVPRPASPVPAGVLDSLLVVTPDEIFLRRAGIVVWLPGPAEGGVVQAVVEPEHVRLSDGAGLDHAELETALWCGDSSARATLVEDLRIAGLTVLEAPVNTVTRHDQGDLATGQIKPSMLQTPGERGDASLGAPFITSFAAAIAAGGALGVLGWSVPLGLLLVAVGLALFGVCLAGALRRSRADRAAVRLTSEPGPRPFGTATGDPSKGDRVAGDGR